MVLGWRGEREGKAAVEAVQEEHVRHIAGFPLAIPLMAGPGAITATLLLAGRAHERAIYIMMLFGVIVAVLALCLLRVRTRRPYHALARDHRQCGVLARARHHSRRAVRSIRHRRRAGGADGLSQPPNTTACMMRPGTKVNRPAITNAPRKMLTIAR